MEILRKVESNDQEFAGNLTTDLAKDLLRKLEGLYLKDGSDFFTEPNFATIDLPIYCCEGLEFVTKILMELKMKDQELMGERVLYEFKWELPLVEEFARAVVREQRWYHVMQVLCILEEEKGSCKELRLGIVKNLAIERWTLQSEHLHELNWEQECKLVRQLLWHFQRKYREMQSKDESETPSNRFLEDLWPELMTKILKEKGVGKWKLVGEFLGDLDMGPKYELEMQLVIVLDKELQSERRWDCVMEFLKELLAELWAGFGMESVNSLFILNYMEGISLDANWKIMKTFLWMSWGGKLGERVGEFVMELLHVMAHAGELVREQRILTEEQTKEHAMERLKALARERARYLKRDQKSHLELVFFWRGPKFICRSMSELLERSVLDDRLERLVAEGKLNSQTLWRLELEKQNAALARKLVGEKECKDVMNLVREIGEKRMWELAMEIVRVLLDREEAKGSNNNAQEICVFRKRQRDLRKREEGKRKRALRKFIDNKVVAGICSNNCYWDDFYTKRRVMEFLHKSRRYHGNINQPLCDDLSDEVYCEKYDEKIFPKTTDEKEK